MLKTIQEFRKDLTNEELGKLINMSCDILENKEVNETENRIINYLFKTQFKPAILKHIQISEKRSIAGKLGGRPKKKGVNENDN